MATKDVNILFHAAAMKQVDTIEYNPLEAIKLMFTEQKILLRQQ